jgi:acetoin utilization deacetylase AcuC-like enzyme
MNVQRRWLLVTVFVLMVFTGCSQAPKEGISVKTGFVYDPIYLEHKTGPGHPECPERLTAIMSQLESEGLMGDLTRIDITVEADVWVKEVHPQEYVESVKRQAESGQGYVDTMDSPASERSYTVAVKAVSGVLSAIDAVMEGRVNNAFCAVRPPGHHALPESSMGFCLFNNVAVAARYLQRKHGLGKVLIVDWDVHHGNGTHDIFYSDDTVMYFSIHQYPFYPGTGIASQEGAGEGKGSTINVPLAIGSGDKEAIDAFRQRLVPAAKRFEPDFVLISAGFDARSSDPLGGLAFTDDCFEEMTEIVKDIANTSCGGKVVSMLEGGYDLNGLASSVERHIRALMR